MRFHFLIFWLLCAAIGHAGETSSPPPLFRDFMGINGHTVQFKPELYKPVARLARDYHPVEWDLGKDSDFTPEFPFARNRVNWETVYGSWKKEGWVIDASLMFETLPTNQWKNLAADSRKYAELFAKTFGPSGKYPLVESVEIGNEPGKFNDADYRTIFESMAKGFREGDSKLKIATCALTTGKSHDYAKSVDCINGLENVYDILNVHSYAQLEGWPTWKRSHPEDPALKEYLPDILNLCKWRDQHAPGKPVWVTEFGYDSSTKQPNPNSEFKKWIGVTDTQQAQWLVRSWLLFSTLPIERAYMYFFNDSDEPQVHGSAGLTRNFKPKPSFYASAHLQKTLGDYRFSKIVLNHPGQALLYEFIHGTEKGSRIWVAWSPTGSNHIVDLQLPEGHDRIQRGELMPLGAAAAEAVSVQNRAVKVGESPIYFWLRE